MGKSMNEVYHSWLSYFNPFNNTFMSKEKWEDLSQKDKRSVKIKTALVGIFTLGIGALPAYRHFTRRHYFTMTFATSKKKEMRDMTRKMAQSSTTLSDQQSITLDAIRKAKESLQKFSELQKTSAENADPEKLLTEASTRLYTVKEASDNRYETLEIARKAQEAAKSNGTSSTLYTSVEKTTTIAEKSHEKIFSLYIEAKTEIELATDALKREHASLDKELSLQSKVEELTQKVVTAEAAATKRKENAQRSAKIEQSDTSSTISTKAEKISSLIQEETVAANTMKAIQDEATELVETVLQDWSTKKEAVERALAATTKAEEEKEAYKELPPLS
jgi:hypothetical protein